MNKRKLTKLVKDLDHAHALAATALKRHDEPDDGNKNMRCLILMQTLQDIVKQAPILYPSCRKAVSREPDDLELICGQPIGNGMCCDAKATVALADTSVVCPFHAGMNDESFRT